MKPQNSQNCSRDPYVQFICSPAQQKTLTCTLHLAEGVGGVCNKTDCQCCRLHIALKPLCASACSGTNFEHQQTKVWCEGRGQLEKKTILKLQDTQFQRTCTISDKAQVFVKEAATHNFTH